MSPALNRTSALQRFERSNAVEIRNGIISTWDCHIYLWEDGEVQRRYSGEDPVTMVLWAYFTGVEHKLWHCCIGYIASTCVRNNKPWHSKKVDLHSSVDRQFLGGHNQNSGWLSLDVANSITTAILTNNILTTRCYTWMCYSLKNDLGSRLATTLTHMISDLWHGYVSPRAHNVTSWLCNDVIYPMTGMDCIQMKIEH